MTPLNQADVINAFHEILAACPQIIDEKRESYTVEKKEDNSLLTEVDLNLNKHICEGLLKAFPDTPIISEENKNTAYEDRKDWKQFFLVDPLDGTREFVNGNSHFTMNIALIENGRSVAGIILAPDESVCYWASEEGGAWKRESNREAVQISCSSSELKGSPRIMLSRSHQSENKQLSDFMDKFDNPTQLKVGSSLKFCWLAEGKADLYFRGVPCMEWDVAAGDCIYSVARGETGSSRRALPYNYNTESLLVTPFLIGIEEGHFLNDS